MVIDASALVALLRAEPLAARIRSSLAADPVRLLSAGTLLEASLVVEARGGADLARELDLLLHVLEVEVVPFDGDQAELARDAWRRFGKGRHPAGLNFGDCFAYALAQMRGELLLCTGDDFARTDAAIVPLADP